MQVNKKKVSLLVPTADTANHSFLPNVNWGLSKKNGHFEIKTDRAIAHNEEVCIYYGELSNEELMHGFGSWTDWRPI